MKKLLFQSFHNHTAASDGSMDHLKLVKCAEQHGVGVLAFTDHDALVPEDVMDRVRRYTGPVTLVTGVELSSWLPYELGGKSPKGLLHIVGLFTDPHNQALRRYCEMVQKSRVERVMQIVRNLQGEGFAIDMASCIERSKGRTIGRPHISDVLLDDPDNLKRLKVFARNMCIAAKQNTDIAGRYAKMMQEVKNTGVKGYVFPLLLASDAFVPDIYVPYLDLANMEESVSLIRGAGGLVILAHYPTIAEEIPLPLLRRYLTEGVLDGIETVYGIVKDMPGDDPVMLERLVAETGCYRSVGADVHHAKDFVDFADAGRFARTPKTLAAILAKAGDDRVRMWRRKHCLIGGKHR
ncbi:MAG: PHP domain-containing protein [Candidatus Yonathbacteria bacterium]|nr:PHP domain-containing protein [Candidatus Yonathbacteria bacterium]